jgi:hypothetical protein
MQSTSNNEEHAMKKGVSTAALAAALMAASVSANAQPGNVGAPPDAAGSPSPLIGVWCWTMNLGQAQLEVFSVTKTSFTGRYIWIGAGAGHRGVAGNVEGNHLAFWSSRATHYDLTLKNDVLAGEDLNNNSGNTHWATFKRGGCRPL